MKIKHWQGYGTVDAKKLCEYEIARNQKKIIIQVTGNHEYGIARHDAYDIYNWLLKRGQRFVTDIADSRRISDVTIHETSIIENNCQTDQAVYEITYWNYT